VVWADSAQLPKARETERKGLKKLCRDMPGNVLLEALGDYLSSMQKILETLWEMPKRIENLLDTLVKGQIFFF
jgi:hypothetical protein